MTISSSSLTAAKNASVGTITLVQGASNQRIASFLLTSGASEGVDVSSIVFEDCNGTVNVAGSNSLGEAFNNLTLKSGGVAIAPVKTTSSSDAITVQYTFYPSPALSIPAGTTVQIDLYADILSNAAAASSWVDTEAVELDSATGTGKITSSASNIATGAGTSMLGQVVAILTGGTLTVAVDTTTPVPTQVKGGSTDQAIAAFRFSANNVEDQTLTQLAVTNLNGANSAANVRNIKLFVGGVQAGDTVPALDASYQAWFRNLNINIPKSGNTVVTVKADITPYAEGESVGNYIVFDILTPAAAPTGATTDTIITKGATSGAYATPANLDTTYYGNAIYPYRTTLTAGLTTTKAATGNGRSANDTVAKLTLTGTSEADAQLGAAVTGDFMEAVAPNGGTYDGDWAAVGAGAMSVNTGTPIAGTNVIRLTEHGATVVTGDGMEFTFDADSRPDLTNYSKLGFWIRSSVATAATPVNDEVQWKVQIIDAGATTTQTIDIVAANTWQFVEVSLPAAAASKDIITSIKIIESLNDTPAVNQTLDVDQIRWYNDSVNLDLAGNFLAAIPDGVPVYLKSGGTIYATGYYSGTVTAGTVTLIPDSLIAASGSSSVYDLITSTIGLMLADTANVEVLSISFDMGSISMSSVGVPTLTAGDFRWYDQAVDGTLPITWMNPSGGTASVSMGY